jgi:DNA-directed RNA polymerase subunit K/omega
MSDKEDYFSDNNISDTESLIEKESSIKNTLKSKNTTANDIISDDEDISDTEQQDADEDDDADDDNDDDENSVVIEGSDDDDDPDSDFEENDNNDVSASANKKKTQSQKYASNFDSLQPDQHYNENLDNFISDDDDNLSDDCEYLDLLESNINSNYLEENHPECIAHNYHEIQSHLTVTKDDYGNVIDPLHKTSPILTKYEKTRIIGQRAKQISDGSKPYIHLSHTIIEPHIIAEMELQEKKLPFIVKRPIPNGGFEYWRLRDLDIIAF